MAKDEAADFILNQELINTLTDAVKDQIV